MSEKPEAPAKKIVSFPKELEVCGTCFFNFKGACHRFPKQIVTLAISAWPQVIDTEIGCGEWKEAN